MLEIFKVPIWNLRERVGEKVTMSKKEEIIDLAAIRDRAHESERSFEEVVKDLKRVIMAPKRVGGIRCMKRNIKK